MSESTDHLSGPTTGARAFGVVLRLPGALRFTVAGFFTRIPLATAGIAIMFLVVEHIGSYAIGGLIVAAYSISRAVAAPYLGKLIDHRGQATIMLPAVTAQVLFLFLLTIGIILDWNLAILLICAIVAGVGTGSPPALVRARWSHLLGSSKRITTAFAWESIVEEGAFILGPIVVAFVVSVAPSVFGISIAAAALVLGSLLLYSQRGTEPARVAREDVRAQAMTKQQRGLIIISAIVYFCVAAAIGSLDVYAVALAQSQNSPWAAGVLIAGLAVGSMVSAFVYGSIDWRRAPRQRLIGAALLFAVVCVPFVFIDGLLFSGLSMVLIGVSVSATLTTSNLTVRDAAPAGRLTESLTWLSAAMGLGVSAGNAVAGLLVDSVSVHAGSYPVVAAAVIALGTVWWSILLIRDRAPARDAVASEG